MKISAFGRFPIALLFLAQILCFGLVSSNDAIQPPSSSSSSSSPSSGNIGPTLNTENKNELHSRHLVDLADYALESSWEDETDHTYHYIANYKGGAPSFKTSVVVQRIHIMMTFQDISTFRIKIVDANNTRWEIPERFPFPHFKPDQRQISKVQSQCNIEVQEDPFGLSVTRKSTGEVIFDTKDRKFIFSDLYIELTTTLPTNYVYGFGERNFKFKLAPGIYTIWGRDDPKIMEYGKGGGATYGHHPVGLYREKSGKFFLTLMRNVNAMDVVISKNMTLTYKMVGGVIDIVFFMGDEYPDTVLRAYHNYLGNFTMMPFWSMGFHQSKWGYSSYAMMEGVVKNYNKYQIPLDVIWSDIDYMVEKELFTVNTAAYPPEKMKQFNSVYNKRWVPIMDPGVKMENPVGPGLRAGLEKNIFVKNSLGQNLQGVVWPGSVYFPDFFNPNTESYWHEMLEVLYETIPYDGIWLDMNEVANFVNGEVRPRVNRYDSLPYTPGNRPLNTKTMSLDAVHYGGYIEYDVHGLYSLLENEATHSYLKKKSKLPFILTRSTSMGMGRFSAHWSGDNGASWEYLKVSIPGNFNFQIFGIPFVGADICGFMDNTKEELCARWTQLGALYPFARNHHELMTRHQEPWALPKQNLGNVTMIETARIALKTRYSILKWYYSLFIETNGAGSIFRPLFFEFPNEEPLFEGNHGEWEFLLGPSVLCTPKVEPGEPSVNAYFPVATWFEIFTGKVIISKTDEERMRKIPAPFNASVPMFLRGGHIIHRQKVDGVLSTEDLNDEFELIVGLDRKDENSPLAAQGRIMGIETFDDDSVSDRCIDGNCLYDIVALTTREETNSVAIEIRFSKVDQDSDEELDTFGVYGLKLYGLALGFMEEDQSRSAYALAQLIKQDGDLTYGPEIERSVIIEDGAFSITFKNVLRVQNGDTLSLEFII